MSSSINEKNENNIKYLKSLFLKEEEFNIESIYNFKRSKLSTSQLITKIFKKFNKKYNVMPKRYNSTIVDNIIFNEKSHIVSVFKDLLIKYDFNDFLKRFYTRKESSIRLPKYFEYYNLYSKIFPNYTSIPECRYLYKNILPINRKKNKESMVFRHTFNYSLTNFLLSQTKGRWIFPNFGFHHFFNGVINPAFIGI